MNDATSRETTLTESARGAPPPDEAVISARRLGKRFGAQEVVCGIDFDVGRGQCFGLLGPNGAGKTTTIRMILGQSPLSSGELQVFGEPMPEQARVLRRRMGVVPQVDNLDPDFTTAENLRVYAGFFGLSGTALQERIGQLLAFVELAERHDQPISTLSGGMRRRLTIARALINNPELIVLDEPTTGLDPQVRHMIWGRLRALRRAGKTLLLTTHYMEEAERLCDDIVIMDHGTIIDRGSPATLIRRNAERDVIEIRTHAPEAEALLADLPGCRLERVGETLYCYADDPAAVRARLDQAHEITYLHRPGNLEDVFLKLTGRELRE